MLVLHRRVDEDIIIEAGGERIRVLVVELTRTHVRLGFEANRDAVRIVRGEIEAADQGYRQD